MIDKIAIQLRWDAAGSTLDERGQRLFAAAEAAAAGWGGLKAVAEITGLARSVPDLIRDQSWRERSRRGASGEGQNPSRRRRAQVPRRE